MDLNDQEHNEPEPFEINPRKKALQSQSSSSKMMRKRRPFILRKVSNLLGVSIFIPKLKASFIPTLGLLKKLRKQKEFMLLKHDNNPYGYYREYQLSPSNTPLIPYHGQMFKRRKSFRDFYSFVFLCRCTGRTEESIGDYQLVALPAREYSINAVDTLAPLDSGDEEDSVDLRAEKFIAKFYQEMRMQKRLSF